MSDYLSNKRICVTGGAGFLGKVVCKNLRDRGVADVFVPRSDEFDLTQTESVERMYDTAKPDIVIHLAAEVGGIGANNKRPGRFFYANLAMGLHLIEEARRREVSKFVQVGTVCAYPKHCEVPFREADFWAGYPEETNAPYGVAKRTLSTMLEAYRSEYAFNGIYLVPVNLYGPEDNFDLESSHVIPAMIRKFCSAREERQSTVELWGTGIVSREFLFVEDAAEAIVSATVLHNDSKPINLGTAREITIADLAELLAEMCGFVGDIVWDATKPDGQPRRSLDITRASELLGWQPKVDLEDGLRRTISWWEEFGAKSVKSEELCPSA